MEAELARISKKESQARQLYNRAIETVRKNRYPHDEALIHERMATFCIEQEDHNWVIGFYLRNAKYCYQRWGASKKVDDIKVTFKSDADYSYEGPESGWEGGNWTNTYYFINWLSWSGKRSHAP